MARRTNAAALLRMYEYVADDGTVYWSLTQSSNLISSPMRLTLQDRKGLMLSHFIGQLRLRAIVLQVGAESDEVG